MKPRLERIGVGFDAGVSSCARPGRLDRERAGAELVDVGKRDIRDVCGALDDRAP